MAFQGYIATEIATDHRDGLLTRREALRRLGLLGLGATGASTLLAACGGDDKDDSSAQTTATPATSATTAPGAAGRPAGDNALAITFPGPDGQLMGAWGEAASPRAAVLIIHENRGLTPHFKALPKRLAADGYSALAVDLLSKEGGTGSFTDEAQATAALAAAPRERLVADLRAGIDELGRRAPGKKTGAMGFCFGGGMTWSLLAVGEARLAAAVPFYGPLPEAPDFSGAKAAVLAIYAGNDDRVNASRDAAEAALKKAGLTHEVRTFPGVDHAFFNDTGPRYNAAAATEAYQAVKDWFGRYLV
jgi:carboxymethylenebutenolidase